MAIALAALATSLRIMAPTPVYAATNAWEIVSENGLRVDVIGASTSTYQGAFLWPNNASLSQEFDLVDRGDGFYRIRARHSGQCLTLDGRGGPYVNGTKIIQYPCPPEFLSVAQVAADWYTQWIWTPSESCAFGCAGHWDALIKNRYTGKCLDANNGAGGYPGQTAVLQQWDCISSVNQWNHWNQTWTFVGPPIQLH